MPFYCVLCSGQCSTGYQANVFGPCPACMTESGLTKETITLALESYLQSSGNATGSVNNLFGEQVKKTNGHKNGNRNQHTAEIAIWTSEIFDYWKQLFDHPDAQLSTERAKCIQKHLLGTGGNPKRSVDDLKKALLGYSIQPIEVKGKVFDDIMLLLKDAKHIETGIEIVNKQNKRRANLSNVTAGAEQYEDFLVDIRRRRGVK